MVEIIRPLDRDEARARAGLRETFILVGVVAGSLLGVTCVDRSFWRTQRPVVWAEPGFLQIESAARRISPTGSISAGRLGSYSFRILLLFEEEACLFGERDSPQ